MTVQNNQLLMHNYGKTGLVMQVFCVCWLTIKVGGDHVPLTLMFQELLSDHVHLIMLSEIYNTDSYFPSRLKVQANVISCFT